jgi:two-component system response regulator HydG
LGHPVAGPMSGNGHAYAATNGANGHAGNPNGPACSNPERPLFPSLIGEDPAVRQALELASSIAATRAPVLIVGQRGTGKTLLARTVHCRSARRERPFIEVDCSMLRENVLEAELFGRAGEERQGKLAKADGGTILLDKIESLSATLQFKVLRFLQDGEYEPAGSHQTLRSDVRVVMATQEDLAALVAQGEFRQDLYYRISVVTLKLPPLRHRGADLDRLADYFRARFAHDIGKNVVAFSADAIESLRRHTWPGNVLELENVVDRAVVLCRGQRIEPAHLELSPRESGSAASPARPGASNRAAAVGARILPLKEALEGPEKQLILDALQALNWNRQETARVLDINRTTLYKKMKKYGLLYDEPVWAN